MVENAIFEKIKRAVLVESILLASLYSVFLAGTLKDGRVKEQPQAVEVGSVGEREYIKWVDFNVSYEALCEAYQWDVDTYEAALEDKESVHVDWIELLAYVGARHGGGNFLPAQKQKSPELPKNYKPKRQP